MSKWKLAPIGFAVLRTPLLPANEMGGGEDVPADETDDRPYDVALRDSAQRLADLVRRPLVRQAIRHASSGLGERIEGMDPADIGGDSLKLAQAAYKYVSRMSERCTPFGLMATVAFARIGDVGQLALPEAVSVRSRLDNTLVQSVADAFNARLREGPMAGFRVRANTTMYAVGDELRFTKHIKRDGYRHFSQGMVARSVEIETACLLCAGWTDVEVLRRAIEDRLDCSPDTAEYFIGVLLDEQLVETELTLVLTTGNCFDELLRRAVRIPAIEADAARMMGLATMLAPPRSAEQLATEGLEADVRELLGELAGVNEARNWMQVDSYRSGADLCLPEGTVNRLVADLQAVFPFLWQPSAQLDELVKGFQERFGEAEVPLLTVADPDAGIRVGPMRSASSPLLNGAMAVAPPLSVDDHWSPWDQFLLEKVLECARTGGHEIVLTNHHLGKYVSYRAKPAAPQVATYTAHVALVRAGDGAKKEPLAVVRGCHGPSALGVMGRFLYGDPELEAQCRMLAEREQAATPDMLAEVVHASQGSLGNIAARPAGLRRGEIVYGPGDSGDTEENRLHCDDLLVRVVDGQLKLRSRSRACDVAPRLASAHNTAGHNLPVYQLLVALQYQAGVVGGLRQPPALQTMRHVPRIRFESLVLAPERWLLNATEIASVAEAEDAGAGFAACVRLARERGLPRYFVLADGDNHLEVDLKCPVSVLALAGELKGRPIATLEESFRAGAESPVTIGGKPGRNEIFLPIEASYGDMPAPAVAATAIPRPDLAACRSQRCLPMQEWAQYEIYCGEAMVDALVHKHLAPLGERLQAEGVASDWFFIRYFRGSRFHVRFRMKLAAGGLARVVEAVNATLAPLYLDGRLADLQLHTYEREVERYGGPEALSLAERLFHGNSAAVARCLAALEHAPDKEDRRWKAAFVVAFDKICAGFQDLKEARRFCNAMRLGYRAEFGESDGTSRAVSDNYRRHGKQLLPLVMDATTDPGHDATLPRLLACERGLLSALRTTLPGDRFELALQSMVHMDCNRLFAFHPRANEMVLYEYLERFLRSLVARGFEVSADGALVNRGDHKAEKAAPTEAKTIVQ